MAEEQGFAQTRARLEEIVQQVRKKDTSLEQSLDLLEEGVRLANQCTELVDHSEWRPSADAPAEETEEAVAEQSEQPAVDSADAEASVAADAGIASETDAADEVSRGTEAADMSDGTDGGLDEEYDDIFADED